MIIQKSNDMQPLKSYINGVQTLFKRYFNKKEERRKSRLVHRLPPVRTQMEMERLVQAALAARDPENSDRQQLLEIYSNVWKDSQVISERDKAEAFLITEPFEVHAKGEEKEDKGRTALFARPWFTQFLCAAMDSEFWGYQLIEFGEQDANGEFTEVTVFPREYVRPFEKVITVYPWDRDGIPYGDHETEYFLLPVGTAENLGKLESISREVIWKTYARADWSEYNERFGKPFLTYKTNATDDADKDRAARELQEFGANLAGVIDSEDELIVTSVASKESSDNYKSLVEVCDDNIAKMMNGQTGTSKNAQWTGTAEVHERVMTEFTKARMKRIQDIINYRLFPFLVAHGYRLDGYEFTFYGLKDKDENTVDGKSWKPDDPAREQKEDKGKDHGGYLGFFALARKPEK